ncbi:NAD(P)-dependent oxidoreductase [Pseudomonas sp. NFX98]|uniref:NAD(P)-dependent oxidoreductase n=1 Tax=Pseudomonas sp. NFX98 TaxID=3399122 RepID=UPI0039FBE5B9
MTKPTIGYIGLGRMGGPMADNLIKKGFRTAIFDIAEDAVTPRVSEGAARYDSPKALAQACDIIFTCLPGPKQALQVMTADNGILAGLRQGSICIECTTGSPDYVQEIGRQIAARGASLIEACVSGGPQNSAAGTLVLMLGGEASVIEIARPALEAIGTQLFHVGPLGLGTTAKLIHNMVYNVSVQVGIEGMALAKKSGIATETMLQILSNGAYGQGAIQRWVLPRMVDGAALGQQHFPIELSYKDLSLATQHARTIGAATPFAALAEQNFIEAVARGLGQSDNRELAAMMAARSGVTNGIRGKDNAKSPQEEK